MASESLIGQGELPDGDGWGASVNVCPAYGFAVLVRKTRHDLFNHYRVEQIAGWPELGRVPLPGVGAVVPEHRTYGRWGARSDPEGPIQKSVMNLMVLGVNSIEVGYLSFCHQEHSFMVAHWRDIACLDCSPGCKVGSAPSRLPSRQTGAWCRGPCLRPRALCVS